MVTERMLSELLPDIAMPIDLAVSGLTDDSRKVAPGDLFLAAPGAELDGRAFIVDAIARHAGAVLAEPPANVQGIEVPVIEVADLGQRKGEIASRFYGEPSESLLIVAITGTNGKTSCSQFVADALGKSGKPCGIVGTLGYGKPGALREAGLTTPGAIELQKRLSSLLAEGCEAVSLEASSHGLAQGRLNGTAIDIGVFTNITRDHLDYHDTFAGYKRAKQLLFEWPGLKGAVINGDDEFGRSLAASMPAGVQTITYSLESSACDVFCSDVSYRKDGFDAEVMTPWGGGAVSSNLLGKFNVSNLLATISVLGLLEYDLSETLSIASALATVPGRMDRIAREGAPVVVIDYAHTPDALEKALEALASHCQGSLWCVVGCGGDRDRGKRPQMGRIASTLADHAIITDDNPRTEDSAVIIADILEGVDQTTVTVEPDRATAIRLAISGAGKDDIVLIAGKGHEDYQEVNGKKLFFSDYVEVEKIVGKT